MISRLLAGTAVATIVTLFGSAAALAAPIDFGGYTGPIAIKYSDFEAFTQSQTLANGSPAPAVGSQNYGIFSVTSVSAGGVGGNILNQSLYTYVGVFSAVTTTAVTPVTALGAIGFASQTTGGLFSLYQIPNANINLTTVTLQGLTGYAGCGGNFQCYNGITNAVGATNVLTWDLGTNSASPNYLLTNLSGQLTNEGHSSGTGLVVGGTDAAQFGPFINIQNDFCFNNGSGTGQCGTGIIGNLGANNWQLLSNDPVTATLVPEPASLALFGAGLLALAGFFGWRRRQTA